MHIAIATLQNALAYARFPNPSMRQEVNDFLETLGNDLDDADYEHDAAGSSVPEAIESLNQTMNEIDSSNEDTKAAIENADFIKDVESDT